MVSGLPNSLYLQRFWGLKFSWFYEAGDFYRGKWIEVSLKMETKNISYLEIRIP